MMHEVRVAAAAEPGIRQIYAGSYKGRNDNFYLLRGACLERMPARLHLNPVARWPLQRWRPDLHRRLLGEIEPA